MITEISIGQLLKLRQTKSKNPFAKPDKEHFIRILDLQDGYAQFYWWEPRIEDGLQVPDDMVDSKDIESLCRIFEPIDVETAIKLFNDSRKGKLF